MKERKKVRVAKSLILIFAVSYQTTSLPSEKRPPLCPLLVQNLVYGQWCEEVFR